MNKKWKKRTGSLPAIIFAAKLANSDSGTDQVIAFKKGDTTNTTELVDYNVGGQIDGDKYIWKIGEVFHNEYFTIKHYTGKEDKYQDTGRYLTANAGKEPTVKVKQSKTVCYLILHIINYSHLSNKRGGWNKKVAKSRNMEVGILQLESSPFVFKSYFWVKHVAFKAKL